jgi:hypothetical protein
MLVAAKANAESASAVPDIVTGVVVNPVGYGKGNTIKEHVTLKFFVSLA